ncbi:hypothetical protein ACFFGH_34220 [Lysobacter korlensis]|uniref:Uncharacterized protein n=1 Tax=Lysobacter korlensis TaxID=553636 RepID=A0ABV6S102_9GAMM
MGTRWESVFVSCTYGQLLEVAEAAKELLPHVLRGRLSLNAFLVGSRPDAYSLECTGFRAGPTPLRGMPSGSLETALQSLPPEVLQYSGKHAELALAALASGVVGSATWLFFSDSLGEAAGAWFHEGALAHSFYATESQVPGYQQQFLAALAEFVPGVSYVDDELFEVVYKSGVAATIEVGG